MARVNVGPRIANPTHDLSLQNGLEKFGMNLDGGAAGVQEIPLQPSSLVVSQGGKKFGSWDPSVSSIEQRTWHGGRGQDDFFEDPSQFYDSQSLWSLTPNKIHQGMQWKFADMGQNVVENLPGSVAWRKLINTYEYFATQFTSPSSALTPTKVGLWIRRVGNPSALSVAILTDDSDSPDTLLGDWTSVTTATVTDFVSQYVEVTINPGELSTSTKYWVAVSVQSSVVEGAHWEIGIDSSAGTSSHTASSPSSWTASTETIYHRISAANPVSNARLLPFWLDGSLYVVDRKDNGNTSTVYINGDRGVPTGATSTTITDATPGCLGANWVANMWAGAKIRIVAGTGEGQTATIASNTTTVLTVTAAFDITPSTNSEYIIYQTPVWQELTTGWSGVHVRDVTVYDKIALFVDDGSSNSQQMRWNAGTGQTHNFRSDTDGDSRGDYVVTVYDTADEKTRIYIADNTANKIRRSDAKEWGNLDFGNAQTVGDASDPFTALAEYNNQLYIFKTNAVWTLSGKKPVRVPVGLETMPSSHNGQAHLSQDLFFYFGWGFSVEQLYGTSLNDMGPWKGQGLPSGYGGYCSAMSQGIGTIFQAYDGGTSGTSAIYCWNKLGYHEVFRGWATSKRIRSCFWQGNVDGNPYLWFDVNGELMYQVWPKAGLNPLNDSSVTYQHEGVLTQSYIDMQSASLPKLYSDVTAHIKNATATGREVRVDYQFDEDVGTTTWYEAGSIFDVPFGTLALGLGNRRNLRLRYRLQTSDSATPLECRAIVLDGFARSPVKYQYNLRIKVSSLAVTSSGLPDLSPDDLLAWLKQQSQSAEPLRMHAIWSALDDRFVIAEPPAILRSFTNKLLHWWGGTMVITLREV